MRNKQMLVSVVFVTWNRKSELKRAIDSVKKQDYDNIEIVLVDNSSTDGTIEMVETEYPEIELLKMEKNLGCPLARNIGIQNSQGEIIFILDDDAWIEPNLIGVIVKKFEIYSKKKIGAIIPQRIDYINGEKIFYYQIKEEKEIFTFTGCAVAFWKEIFDKVSFFPDTHYGSEENYLTIKMYVQKYKLIFLPNVYVHHQPSNYRVNKKIFNFKARNDIIWLWTFCPRILIIPLFILKSISWLKFGYRHKFIFSTFRGLINGIFVYGIKKEKDRYDVKLKTFMSFLLKRRYSMKQ